MITHSQLKTNAKTRLRDARVLFKNKRYDGSIYLCGYAVELALKAIICKQLGLRGVPGTSSEFENIIKTIQKMKTHNLDELLSLVGTQVMQEVKGNTTNLLYWSTVLAWDPEIRYSPIKGDVAKPEAREMIISTKELLRFFWTKV